MLQQPHTDLRDIDAINTNVGDIRATLAELARLQAELAVHIAWEQDAYKLILIASRLGRWNASEILASAPLPVRLAAANAGQEA